MDRDYIIEEVKNEVSKETKVNRLEIDLAIASTFKGIHDFMEAGVKRIKVPYLGKFRERKNLLK